MASKREDVILALGLDPGTFSQDLAAAVSQMKGFSGAVATGHQGAAGAAGADERAHTGLLGKFREFRTEQVQQGRMARFYANELVSIVPAGDAVKGKLQELIGIGIEGAAGGFGFGLALEAAKFAIGGIVEIIQHAKKEEEELAKATAAMVVRVGDETAKLRGSRMGVQDDDTTREKLKGANDLLERRNRLNLEYGNLEGEAKQEAGEQLDILNEQLHVWEKTNGKLEDFVRINKGLLGEQERARAIRESETTRQLEAERRLLLANTDAEKIHAEWTNAVSEATNKYGLGLRTAHQTELAINNAYDARAKKLEEMRIARVTAQGSFEAPSYDEGTFVSPAREKAMEEERKKNWLKDWDVRERLGKSGTTEEWTSTFELPQDQEGKFAALRASEKYKASTLAGAGLSDLYGGTQESTRKQLEDMERMYAQIDEWRQGDVDREAAAMQMKAELDARINEKKLQGAQQFFGTLASMQNSNIKELAAIGKAAAIAQATIDAYVGINKALGQGGFFGFAMATAVGAAAFANVASIASTFEVGGWTGGLAGRPAGIVHGEEFVVRAGPAGRNRGLLEAMNAGATLAAGAVALQPKVTINNMTRSNVSAQDDGAGGLLVLIEETAERAFERAMRDPNSRYARSIGRHTTAGRVR